MRVLKIMLITIILGGLVVPSISCRSEPDTETMPENQLVTVQRGNLTIDITASGNLALSRKEDLAFEVSGTEQEPLTVEEVLAEEGDTVEEGQLLVRLDTTSLEQKVASRERALKTAEQAVRTAEIDLESATDSYRKITYPYDYRTWAFDVPAAVAFTGDAQRELDEAMEVMQELGLSREQYSWEQYWDVFNKLSRAQDDLEEARDNLIRGYGQDVFGTGVVPMKDFWTLRAAQLDMDKASVAVEKANVTLEEARDNLDTAKDELEKALVVAPFAGFITKVNVEGGDEVKRGTVAVQLADPNKFEAEVMVNEMDIFQVKLGGDATVQIDAMPTLILPAKVTHISPTATIEAGVVNYKVKVEIESLEAVMQEQQEAMQKIMQGELPEHLRQAIEEGRITQEQAEEMIKQRQQGQEGEQAQMPTMIPEDFQLREGLTVTVSILVEERKDVLLIPNSAITRQEGKTYVQVVLPEGVTEEREITTGISNWQYTEVIDGLSEGETVIVPQATTTTTPQPGGRMPFMPGRPPR